MNYGSLENIPVEEATVQKNYKNKTKTWKQYFLDCQEKGIELGDVLPAEAFKSTLIELFSNTVSQNVVGSYRDSTSTCGYLLLEQWIRDDSIVLGEHINRQCSLGRTCPAIGPGEHI